MRLIFLLFLLVSFYTKILLALDTKSTHAMILDFETDDILLIYGKLDDGTYVHINLNYFTHQESRKLVIDGKNISIQADLISNTVLIYDDGDKLEYSWPDFERNTTYLAQHNAIIEDVGENICSYTDGMETMRLISEIKSFRTK